MNVARRSRLEFQQHIHADFASVQAKGGMGKNGLRPLYFSREVFEVVEAVGKIESERSAAFFYIGFPRATSVLDVAGEPIPINRHILQCAEFFLIKKLFHLFPLRYLRKLKINSGHNFLFLRESIELFRLCEVCRHRLFREHMQSFPNRRFGYFVLRPRRHSKRNRIDVVSLQERMPILSSAAHTDDLASTYRLKSGLQTDHSEASAYDADF